MLFGYGPTEPDRTRYHHGNLRAALVDAGVDLARTGGPAAVVLRAVSRRPACRTTPRIGTSPTRRICSPPSASAAWTKLGD